MKEKLDKLQGMSGAVAAKISTMISGGDIVPQKLLTSSLEMGLWLKVTSDYMSQLNSRHIDFIPKELLKSNGIEPILKFKSPIKDLSNLGQVFKDINELVIALKEVREDKPDEDKLEKSLEKVINSLNKVASYDYHATTAGVVTHEDIHDVEDYFIINIDAIDKVTENVYNRVKVNDGKITPPSSAELMSQIIKFDSKTIEKITIKLKDDLKSLPLSMNRTFNKCVTAVRTTLTDLLKLVMEHDAKATAATAIKLVQIFAVYDEKVVKPIVRSSK